MLLVHTRLGQSAIHGIGLFSDQFISKGTCVWSFTPGFDLLIAPDELGRLSAPALLQFRRYSYLDRVVRKYVLCFDDARFMNHSDAPNLDDTTPTTHEGLGVTLAGRDIEPGEELTCDYSAFDAEWGTYTLGPEDRDASEA